MIKRELETYGQTDKNGKMLLCMDEINAFNKKFPRTLDGRMKIKEK